MTDNSSPAPAVVPNAPAVETPSTQTGVDLSDLQAEQDAANAKAAEEELYADINKGTDKPEESSDQDDEDAAADDESEDGSEDGTEAPKKRTRSERYRDQLSRERERTASLESELASLRSRYGGGLSQEEMTERVNNTIGPEPQEKDFDNYLQYERAATSWQTRKDMVVDSIRASQKRGQEEHARQMSQYAEDYKKGVEDFRQRNGEISAKEWDAAIAKANARGLTASDAVAKLIMKSPKGAHLTFFLAQSPDRLDRLNRMSEIDAAVEIGMITSRLSMPQARTRTAAPPPSRPPRGGVAPASQDAELNAWLKKSYGDY